MANWYWLTTRLHIPTSWLFSRWLSAILLHFETKCCTICCVITEPNKMDIKMFACWRFAVMHCQQLCKYTVSMFVYVIFHHYCGVYRALIWVTCLNNCSHLSAFFVDIFIPDFNWWRIQYKYATIGQLIGFNNLKEWAYFKPFLCAIEPCAELELESHFNSKDSNFGLPFKYSICIHSKWLQTMKWWNNVLEAIYRKMLLLEWPRF